MSEWRETALGDVAEIIPGYAFKGEHFGKTGAGVIKIKDIVPPKIDVENLEKVNLKNYPAEKLEKYKLVKGDFVVAMTGATIGKIGRLSIDMEVFINQRVAKISPLGGIEKKYIYYSLINEEFHRFIQNNIDSHSAQENISGTSIGRFPILLPTHPAEQKAVVGVLSSLDDKIDLLHRQNSTLEAMAKTIFWQLFVFETTNREAGIISNLVEFNPPRQLTKGVIAPYLEMADLGTSTFHPKNWCERQFTSGMKFINGDTLLARITPCLENGKAAHVTFLKEGQVGWGSTEYIVMRSKLGLHPFFTYILSRNKDFKDYAEGCFSGSSGRQRVDLDHLKNYKISIPTETIVRSFNVVIEPIAAKLHSNFVHIRTAEKLRDMLIPKLMSGEVRVNFGA